jgi:hypothetical protein
MKVTPFLRTQGARMMIASLKLRTRRGVSLRRKLRSRKSESRFIKGHSEVKS